MTTRVRRLLDGFRGPIRPALLVTGMPKSGTTALAMLLGEASGLTVNSDPFHRLDNAAVDFRDALFEGVYPMSELVREHSHEFRGGIVKDPNFIFLLDQLFELLPNIGVVFIVRDPRANIRSILNRVKLPGRPGTADHRLHDLSATWKRVLGGRTPDIDCGDYIRCLAGRWRRAAQDYLLHANRVRLVRYEDFIHDKPEVVRATLHHFGLPSQRPIEHMMNRQFQPRGDRDVSWQEFFGVEGLRAIEQLCGEEMRSFGYEAFVSGG